MKPPRRTILKSAALAAGIAVVPWAARGPNGWCAAYVKKT